MCGARPVRANNPWTPAKKNRKKKGEHMKGLSWLGLVLLVLGLASLVVPIPHREKEGVKVGGASIGIETRHDEKVSPIVSVVLIAAGAALMLAGKKAGS
jgi:hypothetical protein